MTALANAPADHIHKLWEGLGYYRRVRLMQKAAIFIETNFEGKFPCDDDAILALPGIGPYTAGAIASIAFDRPSPILDGNVIRVLTRYYGIKDNPKTAECLSRLWKLSTVWVNHADKLSPRAKDNCSHLNQGMMEIGASICLPKQQAKCEECPIQINCEAHKKGIVNELPNLPQRCAMLQKHRMVVVLKHKGKYLTQYQLAKQHNEGLTEFFNNALEETHKGKLSIKEALMQLNQNGIECSELKTLPTIKHTITHHRITLHCFTGTIEKKTALKEKGLRWLNKKELENTPMPSAHQKLRRRILESA